MKVPKSMKSQVLASYKTLAKELIIEYGKEYPAHQIRLMIADTITSHALSRTLDDVTSAKRLTKNRCTREVNKRIAAMTSEEISEKQDKRLAPKEISW